MWVLQSGACEDIKATFFHYSRTRSQKIALELIDGFKGYLTTDAYAAYSNMHLEDVKNNFCWSHLRRYYVDSIPLDNSGKEITGSKGAEGREYVNLLFKLESEMSDLIYNERKAKRYLDYLLAEMPNADFYNHPEIIDDMLPWSDKLPESCRLTHKHKKNVKK